MNQYLEYRSSTGIARLPLDGSIDLTYRCNNNCRHCWLRLPPGSPLHRDELTVEEIEAIVDEARKMGCQKWSISGGEPMLRPDFIEIFDYITSKSIYYSLNTNGTLITPEIAELMKREGKKMVALYGATPDVHDHITRNPGSFEATLKGMSLLKDAGANFVVQLIPMKDNYHQFQDMVHLASSINTDYRLGASWLYLSADGSPKKNAEIIAQRLLPHDVIKVEQPDVPCEEQIRAEYSYQGDRAESRLFARCIHNRNAFHIDAYGQMAFCSFIKEPVLRYDLRKGSFQEGWETFIPSLADKIQGGCEFSEHCGSCNLRANCRWCPVYAYLEHGRYGGKVEYLCEIAKEKQVYIHDWIRNHRRYYRIGGITIKVESDLPITDDTFDTKFKAFRADSAGDDMVSILHHFELPDLKGKDLGEMVYRKAPWIIYRKGCSWIYLGIVPGTKEHTIDSVGIFDDGHTNCQIYHGSPDRFLKGGSHSLTLYPSDQILLARILADRDACLLHSAGVILDGKGLLFLGHSSAGKSTTVKLLKDMAEILCDDRIIVRRWPEGFRVHGTWSHGEVPLISPSSAPLSALLFLKKSERNCLTLIDDKKMVVHRLLGCLIRSLETPDWWHKMISLAEEIAKRTPCYQMEFDKSGDIVRDLKRLIGND